LGAQTRVLFEAEVWPKDYSYATPVGVIGHLSSRGG